METADFSLAIEPDKGVYAITPLNDVSKEWLAQNIECITWKGANLIQKDDLLEAINKIIDSEFSMEIWKKSPLLQAPNSIEEL